MQGPALARPIQRDNDVFLMDAFIDNEAIPRDHLPAIQEVRLHVKADTLADIATASGTRITQECWNGQPHTSCARPNWIRTRPPSYYDLQKWQNALRSAFLFPHTQSTVGDSMGIPAATVI